MKSQALIWAVVLAAITCAPTRGGEPPDGQTHRPHFFRRLAPVGGWNPDGGGLFHWWNPRCFPRSCGPDDYCRKPMPNVCRPCPPSSFGTDPLQLPAAPAPRQLR
jgi:hypothetical protein